jgi:hypothetical protein
VAEFKWTLILEQFKWRVRMLIITFTEAVWPCIAAAMDYIAEGRKDHVPDLVKSGLNFSILLGSACFVEGVLEALLREILNCRRVDYNRIPQVDDLATRGPVNSYYNRLEEELSRNIGRTLGSSGYDEMFALLTGRRLSRLSKVEPFWEGVTILFNFRNVLGHGREVSAKHFQGGLTPGGFREEFSGSYKKVEDYLHKKKLLARRFVEAHSEFLFLTTPIADHFWELARALPEAVMSSLAPGEEAACRKMFERVAKGQ